jgi:uncharacterized SAM-dependent methyltransferase
MHLVSLRPQAVSLAGRRIGFAAGETIHTENSHKFTVRSAQLLLAAGGWEPRARWMDEARQFSLMLAESCAPRSAP